MQQQSRHKQPRYHFRPINLPVKRIQLSAVVKRPKDERSQAENVEVRGAGGVPAANENEQADEEIQQANRAKVIFCSDGLCRRRGYKRRFEFLTIARQLV